MLSSANGGSAMKNSNRFIKLTGEQYRRLIEFNKAYENEMVALMFAKKDGRDVVAYSVLCDERFTKESTEGSLQFNIAAVEEELAAANPRDGADAAVILHTHPPDNYPQLSLRDKIAYRVWALEERKYNLEIFAGVILAPHITFWDCEGFRIDKMGLMVDGVIMETPEPVSTAQMMIAGFKEGWSGMPSTGTVFLKKDAKNMTGDHIIIPDGYSHIEANAFEGRKDIVSVTLPAGIIKIGAWAFASCKKLSTVSIPEGVTEIERNTFFLSKNLEMIQLPDGLTTIDSDSFYGCENLRSVMIPGSVASIHKNAFKGCKQLTVTCPAGSYAHQYCLSNKIDTEILR
jgi:hypothetical protein